MRVKAATGGNLSFKRKLRKEEIADYTQTLNAAKQKTGQTGKSILIVHDTCLPQNRNSNTGLGTLSSQESLKFFETMKTYLGINTIEILPQGPISPKNGIYCAYDSAALPLANHVINPQLLTGDKFGRLITQEDIQEVVKKNISFPNQANYKNVMDDDSPFDKMLKKAFDRFKNIDESSDLKKNYKIFEKENLDWLEPLTKNVSEEEKSFFKFKQFLAEEHLKIARSELNKMGLKLYGDCEIGFSPKEVAAFPDAFAKDTYIGLRSWGLPALNYDNILDSQSASHKLLKKKVQLAARRYDSIRFDVSWCYVTPLLTQKDGTESRKEMGDSLLKLIEGWVKEVKGGDFDVNNLLHEFEASATEFRAMKNDNELIYPLKGRKKVYSSAHLSENWGTNDAFLNYRKWSPDEFVIGVGNHDPQPLRQIAEGTPDFVIENGKKTAKLYKKDQIGPLARILNISETILQNPIEFAKAKFAEPMSAKNNMLFYMDVFGCRERFDMQNFNNPKAYSFKIWDDFETAYIKAVREGFGFNPMDALAKVFKAKGLDKSEPDLYKKLIKYRDILLEKEPAAPLKKHKFFSAAGIGLLMLSAGALTIGIRHEKAQKHKH